MKFFENVATFFNHITVKERGNQIRVTGLDATIMRKWMSVVLESDTIAKTIFTEVTDTAFSFNKFFAPDVIFILKTLKESPKCGWGGKRSVHKMIDGIETNTWFKITKQPYKPITDPTRVRFLKWTPMPKQLEFLGIYGHKLPQYNLKGYILAAGAGTGKDQPLYSKIKTPSGWIQMGQVKLNDTVSTPDGKNAKVVGIYPQGKKPVFRVFFEDGRSADCGLQHLWSVYSHRFGRYDKSQDHRVMTLEQIIELLKKPSYSNRLYVDLISKDTSVDVDLPIDPYVLGVILGDAHIGKKAIVISNPDRQVIQEVSKYLPESCLISERADELDFGIINANKPSRYSKNEMLSDLDNFGLVGKLSYEKYIPEIYLQASFSQRLSLIQGLMDTDGTVDEGGSSQYCTSSPKLAYQMQYLIRSIGGLCKISTKMPTYTHKNEKRIGRQCFILNIRYKNAKDLFRLDRKKDRIPENYQYKDSLRLKIKSIKYIGEEETQCIAIDHPDHLYITDEFIVTHNTFSDLMVATCLIPPEVAEVKIIISPKKAIHLVWEKTIQAVFKKTPTCWISSNAQNPPPLDNTEYYVFNFEQLDKAIELGKKLREKGKRYFVIVDESHNFADYRSNRTQRLVDLQTIKDDIYFLWASGTPILKTAAELVSFLKCSDPTFDDDAERRFKKIFTTSPGRANEIFNHRLGQMMAFFVPKSEVSTTRPIIKELPVRLPKSISDKFLISNVRLEMKAYIQERLEFYKGQIKGFRQIVDRGLETHQKSLKTKIDRRMYDAYRKDLRIIMNNPDLILAEEMARAKTYERRRLLPSLPLNERKQFKSALSAVKNIKLKVRGEALGKILAKRRSECAAALGLYCNPEDICKESLSKTIFFSSTVLPAQKLHDKLVQQGFQPLLIYGGTNSQLTQMMQQFDDNPLVNPICTTFQSLSEAVPVISASTVVFLNRPWRDSVVQQAVARADRLGQKFQVTLIEVTLDTGKEPNVSSTTDAILADVKDMINELVGPDFVSYQEDEKEVLPSLDKAKQIDDHALDFI